VEARIVYPMLDLALFGGPDSTGATVGALASGAGILAEAGPFAAAWLS
jgi:hypothetical protein